MSATNSIVSDKVKESELKLRLRLKDRINTVSKISELEKELEILETVNLFLSEQIKYKMTDTKYKLESLVNQGLSYIFGEHIRIVIDSSYKNNKTVFSLRIHKENINSGLADSFGGGVLAVVASLLKISAVLISGKEKLLVFDESLAFVSEEYQGRMSVFLNRICEQMGFTIILIAHQPKLTEYAHKIYRAVGEPEIGISFKEIKSEEAEND